MKHFFSIILLIIIAGTAMSQNYNVKQSDYNQIKLLFTSPEIQTENVTLLGTQFCKISMSGFSSQSVTGMPALPSMVKTIEVPLGDGLKYEIISMTCDTLDGNTLGIAHPVVPAQPSRSKSDRSTPTLAMNNTAYGSNSFCGNQTIVIDEIGVARNRNLATITFNPVTWNPTTNQLIVVRSITLTIKQKNADADATMRMKRLYASADYGYGIETVNSLDGKAKEARLDAPVRYTIVAHSMFRGALDEFADWKRRKGFLVDLVYTDDEGVGSTSTSISQYLKSLYTNATETEPAPTYVLLVGDVAQIPAFQMTTQNTHSSDLNYVCWTTGDKIPDCYIGRFSAQNLEQLTPQISKTLMYEQYTFPDDSYLSKAVLIAGVDGGSTGDFGYTHADPTMDYVAYNYVNSANGFTSVTYYKNNTNNHPTGVTVTGSSQSNSTASALKALYNNGVGLVNYSAHGDKTLWNSPKLTVSEVEQMTNQNKPMIAIGNCCLTNSYQISTCLGEAFLRKGNNAGGVGYIGASEVTYWDEDVYWSMGPRSNISASMGIHYNASNMGMYDQLFHTHGESHNQWHITMGAMMFAGNMAVQSSTASTSMKTYYWEIYHLMGDPSLMPYIHGPAQTMTVSAPDVLPLGQNTIDVLCVPYAYVALTDENHDLMAATFADANGNATLTINSDNISVGNYEIAVSAQGYQTYFTPVTITPIGTYVKATSMIPTGSVVAGEPISFDITLNNMGVNAADSLWIEFRSTDDKMLLDTTGIISLHSGLNADGVMTLNGRCPATIWNDVKDQDFATINVTVYWSLSQSTDVRSSSMFRFPVNAAKVTTVNHSITSPMDNTLTAQLSINSINEGHAPLADATASLFSLDPTLTITGSEESFTLQANGTLTRNFTITTTDTTPMNRIVPMLYTIANNEVSFTDSLNVVFGEPYKAINFNDNTWGDVSWTQGTYPWEITSYNPYEGDYCIRSKTWSSGTGNRKSSEASISITTFHEDSVSFFYRVSSEEDYDNFNFYIDNNLKMQVSGEVDWTRAAFFLSAGTHTLRFSYAKDYYADDGEDAAFVDNLILPTDATAYIYYNDTICTGAEYTVIDTTIATDALNEGLNFITINRTNVIYTIALTVMAPPQAAIEGGETTIRRGEALRLTATGGSRYIWNSGEKHPVIDIYPTDTTTYSVTVMNGGCSAVASTTITVEGSVLGIDNSQLSTLNSQLSIYPNPANDKLNIDGNALSEIIITDIVGRIEKKIILSGSNHTTIDIHNLPKGIHIIQSVSNNGKKSISKFIKQ